MKRVFWAANLATSGILAATISGYQVTVDGVIWAALKPVVGPNGGPCFDAFGGTCLSLPLACEEAEWACRRHSRFGHLHFFAPPWRRKETLALCRGPRPRLTRWRDAS